MFIVEFPWVFVFLLVPFLLRMTLPPYRIERAAIRVPWFNRLSKLLNKEPSGGSVVTQVSGFQYIGWILGWFLIVLAIARPQFIEAPINRVVPVRDLMLLVDLSGSMETRDFTNKRGERVDRLSAIKEILDDFLSRREGDRVGLIVFGNAAFVQVPFTQDLEACRLLLEETAVRMAGPRTSFGDAIGLGITLFQRSELEDRVIIALTDGNDTGSKIPPFEAAKVARDNEITIHVVGLGDPTATGEEQLDEEALLSVAETTGGMYFHGGDRTELESIYTELDQVVTREIQTESYRPRRDLFHLSIATFFVLSLIYHLIAQTMYQIKKRRLSHD